MSKAALITGGSSGIGYAIAKALLEDGFVVTVSARRPEKLEAAAKELGGSSENLHSVPADVSDEAQLQALLDSHLERFGQLNLLVNNAGVGIGGPIEGYDAKKLDMQIAVNFRAAYLLTGMAVPALKEAGSADAPSHVVNIASIAGKSGQGWLSAYAATKAAIVNFTEGAQKELGNDGVKLTAICPAFVDTPMTEFVKEHIPAEKMIQPEDVAETVRYLLKLSPVCVIPEIIMQRQGEAL